MGALTLGRGALLAALAGLLLAPWYGLENGAGDLASWPSGAAAPSSQSR